MNGRCETDPFDQAVDVCDSCYGEFCGNCLVEQRGRRHPLCKECVIVASGLRTGAKVVRRGEKKTAKARRKELGTKVDKGREFKFFDEEQPEDDPMLSPPAPLPSMEPVLPPLFDGPDPALVDELAPLPPTAPTTPPPPPVVDPVGQPHGDTGFDTPFDPSTPAGGRPGSDPEMTPVAGAGLETFDRFNGVGDSHGFDGLAPDRPVEAGPPDKFGTGAPRFDAADPVPSDPSPSAPPPPVAPPAPATSETWDPPTVGFGGGPSSAISQLSQLRNDDRPEETSTPFGEETPADDPLASQVPDLTRSPFETAADRAEPEEASEASEQQEPAKLPRPRLHADRPSTDKPGGRNSRTGRKGSSPTRAKSKPPTGRSLPDRSDDGRSGEAAGGSPRRGPNQVRPPGHPGATRRTGRTGGRGPASNAQAAALAETAEDRPNERSATEQGPAQSATDLKPKRRGPAAPGSPTGGQGRARRKPTEVPPALRGPMPDDGPDAG